MNVAERVAVDEQVDALYRAEYRRMVGVARLLVGSAAAEEIVQDAFVRLLAKWPKLRDPDKASGYLHRTVVNLSRGRLRRRAARGRKEGLLPVGRAPDRPDELAMHHADRVRIEAALPSLSRRQQECVVLRYFAGMTEPEVAATLGIAVGSVKSHVHRAMETLERVMEGGR